MKVKLICPKCGKEIFYKNLFEWILHTPFHSWSKRYTKCPHCGERSLMGRVKNDRIYK